jgi:hypothetical protein
MANTSSDGDYFTVEPREVDACLYVVLFHC